MHAGETKQTAPPFVDAGPHNNLPLTATEKLSLAPRMKVTPDDNYNHNKNLLVIGPSGSGKSRGVAKPEMLEFNSNYIVTDTKGELLDSICNVGKKCVHCGVQPARCIPAGISGQNFNGAVSHQRVFVAQQPQGFVKIRIPAVILPALMDDLVGKGEVDYLIDEYDSLSAVPLEIKSGKDYTVHSALRAFVKNADYHVEKAFVRSNERVVQTNGKITYMPIYYVMFF